MRKKIDRLCVENCPAAQRIVDRGKECYHRISCHLVF